MHYFLGLEVWQSPEGIFLYQGKICSRNPEEISYVGEQGHNYAHGHSFEVVGRYFVRVG
jgi:hypothetical protein